MKLDLSLHYEPERIISIVCPSRSGSTVMKHALAMHPDVCSLAGEEEPYYKLAKNGWPWHQSDKFVTPQNPELIRALIANELLNDNMRYANRLWLQKNEIEEPPFVKQVPCEAKPILILKTPQNCYRRGVLEHLYPRAKIDYVVITRDRPAIINGLIDGWESDDFKARLLDRTITWRKGWKQQKWHPPEGGMWWKFDMPPGWGEYVTASTEEKCRFQCDQAIKHCNEYYARALRLSYEDFCRDWKNYTRDVWVCLGLRDVSPEGSLPSLGVTDAGGPERWREKRPWLATF